MTGRARQRGFTLIEVMVALVIGGMAVASAAALLHGLGNRAQAIGLAATRADGDANGERLLRALVTNIDLTSDTTKSFAGTASSATFPAWCDTPAGWLTPCVVRLAFERREGASVLGVELRSADSSSIEVRRAFQRGRFRYLVEIDRRRSWVDRWSKPVPPTAVAVIIDGDTLLLPVWGGG